MFDFAVKPSHAGAYSAKEEEVDSSYPSRDVRRTPITAATNKVPPTSTLVMAVLAPSTTPSKNLCMPRNLPFVFNELYATRPSLLLAAARPEHHPPVRAHQEHSEEDERQPELQIR
jgi:hypothetical protein